MHRGGASNGPAAPRQSRCLSTAGYLRFVEAIGAKVGRMFIAADKADLDTQKVLAAITPASTTSCMLLKREPSLSSMNVMPLESRRERTQPRRVISLPTDKLKACLTETNRDAICAKYREI